VVDSAIPLGIFDGMLLGIGGRCRKNNRVLAEVSMPADGALFTPFMAPAPGAA